MTALESIGHLIRLRRKKLGLSLQSLADLCGTTLQHLSHIERGEMNTTVKMLEAIATALGQKLELKLKNPKKLENS